MEPESSSPHSQAPANCPYPEPTPSSPHNPFPLPDYATNTGNSLPTFRENISVRSSKVKNLVYNAANHWPSKTEPAGCPETSVGNTTTRCVITQKSAVLSWFHGGILQSRIIINTDWESTHNGMTLPESARLLSKFGQEIPKRLSVHWLCHWAT